MSHRKKMRALLRDAIGGDKAVLLERVSRPTESVTGFVVALGKQWALLQRVMDGGYFGGHAAISLHEVKAVRMDTSFQSAFAATQPEWPPQTPPGTRPELDGTPEMLRSLLRHGELVGIEQNKKYDAKWIGVPNELTPRWLYLWEARPDGSWNDRPLGYRLRNITIVTIRDPYQRALAVIAGAAPADASPPDWAGKVEAAS